MNIGNLLKNKWFWIIGGFILLIIIIAGGSEEKSVPEITQPQISQEQQVLQKTFIPVAQLINKTPSEIEAITGQKLKIYGKKPSGKLMEAGFTIEGIDVWTVYTLITHPKVKYNGTILFQISFDNPVKEEDAWKIVGFPQPAKNKATSGSVSGKRIIWENIPDIKPFYTVKADYVGDKIEWFAFYFLSEAEETPLYEF